MNQNKYKEKISGTFSSSLIFSRKKYKLSQELMSECLDITPREYSNLERGVSCGSTQSFVLFLISVSDNEALEVIRELREKIGPIIFLPDLVENVK